MANLQFFQMDVHTYTHVDKKVYDRLEIYFNVVYSDVVYKYTKHANLNVAISTRYKSLPQDIADIFNIKTTDLNRYKEFKKGA